MLSAGGRVRIVRVLLPSGRTALYVRAGIASWALYFVYTLLEQVENMAA